MSRTFRQADYGVVKGISMAGSGCGPSAVASIAVNQDISVTPVDVAAWLYRNGYFSSAGTTRTGITKALDHYGFQSLYFTPEHKGGKDWRTAMELVKGSRKGDIWAISLVVGQANGGRDNLWTNGGHYLAITDYDPASDKVYVRDSGSRNRTGYYSSELLRHDTNALWVITKKAA